MLQYLLTGLAGLVIGIVAMRVWQARENADGTAEAKPATPIEEAKPAHPGFDRTRLLLFAAAAIATIGVAVLLLRPTDEPEVAAVATPAAGQDGLADVDTMIARLTERLKTDTDDGEGFRMLGWSYVMTGRPKEALEPYRRALQLLPDNAAVHAGYGEALAGIAGGKVTAEAKSHFEQAHALDAKEPRSRYFIAKWLAQNGRKQEALDQWIVLANEGPADASWQTDLRSDITATAAELGIDVSARLRPAANGSTEAPPISQQDIADLSALPADEQQQAIAGMVESLATRLKGNPADPDGWIRLLRSRMVLKQPERARDDLAAARRALAADTAGLKRVNAEAAQLEVPGA